MIKVIEARGPMGRRAFCRFPGLIDEDMGRRAPKMRALFAPERTFFMSLDGKKPVARASVWRPAGETHACFAHFDCLDHREGVRALFDAASAHARALGAEGLFGPVAPGPTDYGKGVLTAGFDAVPAALDAYNQPWYAGHLTACGFHAAHTFFSYQIDLEGLSAERLHRAADWTGARYALRASDASDLSPRMICAALHAVDGPMGDGRDYPRAWAALAPYTGGQWLWLVHSGAQPVGYLIAVPGPDAVRLASLYIAPNWRRRGAALMLMDAFLTAARRRGVGVARASLIDQGNADSRRLVEAWGGQAVQTYRQYEMRC